MVVADDENLEVAARYGCHRVLRENHPVGRKFNDGFQYACEHDADWVGAIGSDGWLHPDYFNRPMEPDTVYTGPAYAVVAPDGSKVAITHVKGFYAAGPLMFHRSTLERLGWRPYDESLDRGIDTSAWMQVSSVFPQVRWEWRTENPCQLVGFRSSPQITSYREVWEAWGLREEPLSVLAEFYPERLVGRVREFYGCGG